MSPQIQQALNEYTILQMKQQYAQGVNEYDQISSMMGVKMTQIKMLQLYECPPVTTTVHVPTWDPNGEMTPIPITLPAPGPQSGYMVLGEADRASGHKRKLIEEHISSIDPELENLQERLYPLRSRLASSSLEGRIASQIASTPMLQTTRYGSAAPTPKIDYAQGMARGCFNGHPAGPFPGYRISTRLCL